MDDATLDATTQLGFQALQDITARARLKPRRLRDWGRTTLVARRGCIICKQNIGLSRRVYLAILFAFDSIFCVGSLVIFPIALNQLIVSPSSFN